MPIIVLNLDRAASRKETMVQQFKDLKIFDYHFLSAFDGRYLSNLTLNANIGMGYGAGRLFQKAELAIIMTHLAAIKFAQMMDYESVIVLEDDVVLCKDWNTRLKTLKETLPNDWEYVYLSGHSDYVRFNVYEKPTLISSPKMVGAFSYMVNNTAYKKIIDHCMSFMTTFDDMVMYAIEQKKLVGYTYFPFMTFHNANDSYVWNETPGHLTHNNNMHSSYKYFKFNV